MKVFKYLGLLVTIALLTTGIIVLSSCNTKPHTLEGKIAKGMSEEIDKQLKERMPRVDVFKFGTFYLLSGDNVSLNWKVSQADNITIDNSLGAVQPVGDSLGTVGPAGSRQFVFPRAGKTTLAEYIYTLTASNKYGKVTGNATVMVMDDDQPPGIYFEGSPARIKMGKGAHLEWNVMFASEVSMDDGSGPPSACEQSGEKIVNPLKTTTYTITAVNKAGVSIKSLILEVIPADD